MKKFLNDLLQSQKFKWGLDMPYFATNSSWIGFQQVIGSLVGLALFIAFARLVDKNIFGQYQLAISIFSFISILALPGLNVAMTRSVARGNEGDYARTVKKSFIWGLWGIPMLLAVGSYYYFFRQNHALGMALMAVSWIFPFFYAPNSWSGFFWGKRMFRSSARLTALQSVIVSMVIISTILLFKNNLLAILYSYCLSYAVLNVIYYVKSLKYVSNKKTDPETVRYGFFLTLTTSFEILSENIDKIIIGIFLSPGQLAAFAIVSLLPLSLRNVTKPFVSIFFPKMTDDSITFSGILKNNKKALGMLLLLVSLGSIIYLLLIEKVNYLFFGSNYANSYFYSRYFIIFVFLFFPLLLLEKYLQAKKMRQAIIVSGPVFVIIKSALIVAGIYWQGLLGAIIAFNLAILVKFLLSISLIKKQNERS